MQIIAGRFRGLKLASPAGRDCRPTLSRVRQALFNILRPTLLDCVFLDLYSGAGGIGLEAFSEGAKTVWMVEQDREIFCVLKTNALKLDNTGTQVRPLNLSAEQAVTQFNDQHIRFDLIFLDPPYKLVPFDVWAEASLKNILTNHGRLILQHDKRLDLPSVWSGCTLDQTRRYGETSLSFYTPSEILRERQEMK